MSINNEKSSVYSTNLPYLRTLLLPVETLMRLMGVVQNGT